MPGHQIVDGVDRRVGRAAGSVGLDGDAGELPVRPEVLEPRIGVGGIRRKALVEAAPDLFEDHGGTGEALLREHGAHEAAPGGVSGVKALILRAVVDAGPEPGCKGACEPQSHLRLTVIELKNFCGCRGGAEGAARAG